MKPRHPKSVRRRLLTILYERYLKNPLDMLTPEDLLEDGTIAREDLVANIHYLHDRELVELMMGYNPPLFAAARITADGIDLVESPHRFDVLFPPSPDEREETQAEAPVLLERLVCEADCSPLDGEARQALLRDVQFLRDEVARPASRWRREVIQTVLEWIEGHFRDAHEDAQAALPSLAPLKQALEKQSP